MTRHGLGTRVRRLARTLAVASIATLSGCGAGSDAVRAFDPDSIPEGYARSTAALMWPGATRAFQVTPSGDLYNGDWSVRFHLVAAGAPAAAPRVIAYQDRWRPITRWTRRSGPVRWEFEALALPRIDIARSLESWGPAPTVTDSNLLVSLEVRAVNHGDEPCEARLEAALVQGDTLAPFVAFDAPADRANPLAWAGARGGRPAWGWCGLPASGGVAAASWRLGPSESRAARFVLPAYPLEARSLASWARAGHASRREQVRRFWDTEMARGLRLELGDPEIERSVRAALTVLLSCRERRGAGWVPIGGPFHYRDVWLRDGARAIAALSMAGFGPEARALAGGLLAYQWPPGAFLSQRGQLDGTGQALWAFEQALLRPAPDASIARFATAALKAWRWCEWQRDLGRSTGWRFGTMMPMGEPKDNELVRAQLVGNDAWTIAGYRAAERLLRASGRATESDSVAASLDRYRDDFRRALAVTGKADVPASWQGVGRDWGNLTVAYPCAALPASDPRCAALARRVWETAGGPGLCIYGDRDSIHYYLGADLGTWALLADRRDDADRVLDAMLRWRSASGGAAELFSRSTRDYGNNPPPHATSAAALVIRVRNALVFDDDDTLRVALGARAAWWRGGRVRGAPTRWGVIDLELSERDGAAEWRWTAVPVWTALTLPPGTRLARDPDPPLTRGRGDAVVLAPPGTRSARVEIVRAGAMGSAPAR